MIENEMNYGTRVAESRWASPWSGKDNLLKIQ